MLDEGCEGALREAGKLGGCVDEAYGALRDLRCEVRIDNLLGYFSRVLSPSLTGLSDGTVFSTETDIYHSERRKHGCATLFWARFQPG